MDSPSLTQFIRQLLFNVTVVAVLCGIGGSLLRIGLRWFERRALRFGEKLRGNTKSSGPESSLQTYYIGGPHCPSCNRTMVKRTARRGGHAGSEFWGCSNYPECRGTRAAAEPGS